jgi:serine protease Do
VLNTGNSGGPMFTRAGDLIGIVSHNISKSGGSEGLGFVVTANTVRGLLLERKRGWFGIELMLVTGSMAQALRVPQEGGFLVKQVVKGSVGERIGLRGGDRVGIVDGQQIVVGGDVLLSVQGITVASAEDRARALKALETVREGDVVRVTVLRGDKVVELSSKFTGF